jgi:dihydroorotate dehydrogenase (fumarate)
MADLRVNYMGIELANPVVVGACSLSKQIDTIKQIEAAGAGGLVIKSIFEEQIQLEQGKLEDELSEYEEVYAEAVTLFPQIEHGGPKEHLYWVAEAKRAVSMPLIASINAVHEEVWAEYAIQLADTGVDGLELNFYSLPLDPDLGGGEIEKRELDVFARIREAVKIPIAVKLHPYYTNMMNVASAFDRLGANAVVLFNRLFQPDISVTLEAERTALRLSQPGDLQVPLRWAALLHGRINADIISATGVMSGRDVLKMLLAGATAVQVVSTLYRNRLDHIGEMLAEISTWMDGMSYQTLDDFRGKVSKRNVRDPWAFERGQYIKALLGFD